MDTLFTEITCYDIGYRQKEIDEITGKLAYYKSQSREIWFDENRNIIKEKRFENNNIYYLFISHKSYQDFSNYTIFIYNEDGEITNENRCHEKKNSLFKSSIYYDQYSYNYRYSYRCSNDEDIAYKWEEIFRQYEHNNCVVKKLIYKYNGLTHFREIAHFDSLGNLLHLSSLDENYKSPIILVKHIYINSKLQISHYNNGYKEKISFCYSDKANNIFWEYNQNLDLSEKVISYTLEGDLRYWHELENHKNVKNFVLNNVEFQFNEDQLLVKCSTINEDFLKFRAIYDKGKLLGYQLLKYNDKIIFDNQKKIMQKISIHNFGIPKDWQKAHFINPKKNRLEEVITKDIEGNLLTHVLKINNNIYSKRIFDKNKVVKFYFLNQLKPNERKVYNEMGNIVLSEFHNEKGFHKYIFSYQFLDEGFVEIKKTKYLNLIFVKTETIFVKYF